MGVWTGGGDLDFGFFFEDNKYKRLLQNFGQISIWNYFYFDVITYIAPTTLHYYYTTTPDTEPHLISLPPHL